MPVLVKFAVPILAYLLGKTVIVWLYGAQWRLSAYEAIIAGIYVLGFVTAEIFRHRRGRLRN